MNRRFFYVDRILSTGYETKEPDFELPKRSTANSAGYDFFAIEDTIVEAGKINFIKTGVKAKMLEDEMLLIFNRSSNPSKKGLILSSGVNVIDADYYGNPDNDGEIAIIMQTIGKEDIKIKKGEKICQAVFVKYLITDDDNAEGIRNGRFWFHRKIRRKNGRTNDIYKRRKNNGKT